MTRPKLLPSGKWEKLLICEFQQLRVEPFRENVLVHWVHLKI